MEPWEAMTLLLLSGEEDERDAWVPTVAQVAAILRARTRGVGSRDATVAGEHDVFDTTTRPTYAQVEELICIAVDEMLGLTEGRAPCSTGLSGSFRAAALYRAAMLVETSYAPEQTNGDTTAFKALESMWASASKSAAAAIIEQCPVTSGDTDPDHLAGVPIGRVPCRIPTRWGEQW